MMKPKFTPCLLAALLGVTCTSTLHAQLVADGNLFGVNTATNLPGDLIVGTNGGNTTLNIIGPNGTVTNANGRIGLNATSTNNVVRVRNSGAVWNNTGNLYVGDQGAGNLLFVTNGGNVFLTGVRIGNANTAAGNRTVVTGTNSLLSSSGAVNVGYDAPSNLLVIADGARVANNDGYIGRNSSASNNWVTVTDPGSSWTNSGTVYVGNNGLANQLLVTNEGKVFGASINIGSASSATWNQAVVTGTNSLLSGSGSLTVGYDSSSNSLVIAQGAWVANGNGNIGDEPNMGGGTGNSSNNWVMVTDPGSLWTNSGNLYVGDRGSGSRLVVSNGAVVFNGTGILGNYVSSSNNAAVVTGLDSVWTNANDLTVGSQGSQNTLLISDGGTVFSAMAIVGDFSSSDNLVVIDGVGSQWIVSGLLLGSQGSDCHLIVTNGAVLEDVGTGFMNVIGGSGFRNQVVISGADSAWNSSQDLTLGGAALDGSLVVSNGAVAHSGDVIIGETGIAENNQAIVTGSGSVWHNSSVVVGKSGPSSQVRLQEAGSAIVTRNVIVGQETGSSNNLLHVDGGTMNVATNLEVRRGTLRMDRGFINAGTLLATNATLDGGGLIQFNGGILPPLSYATLSASNTLINNGAPLVVGNGSPAVYRLLGNGVHSFNDGLAISDSASLRGSGTINGPLTVAPGGLIDYSTAGSTLQKLNLNQTPSLSGAILMRLRVAGGQTNDQISVSAPLIYGGLLSVSRLSAIAPTNGNSFKLFSAPIYGGAFSSINLPDPAPGLMWTNRLLVDGTVAVVPLTPPTISHVKRFGTNLVLQVTGGSPGSVYDLLTSTNVTLPMASWTVIGGGNFDWMGKVTITNGIDRSEPERYLRVLSFNTTSN